MTGPAARVCAWLVHREPLWLVTGAGAVLDVASYVVPVVPDSWHVWVNAVVVVLGVVSGRAMVSPVTASGGVIPLTTTAVATVPARRPAAGPAGTSNVRMVGTVLDRPAPTTPPAGMPGAQVVDAPKPPAP